MSFEEARAAAPDAAWTQKSELLNPARTYLEAPSAVSLFGGRYDVQIKPGVHGAARIDFHAAAPGVTLRECQARVVALVADLEPRFGSFEAIPNAPPQRGAEIAEVMRRRRSGDLRMELPGFVAVSAGSPVAQVVSAGAGSRVNFFTNPTDRGRGSWQSIRQPQADHLQIGVGASYAPDPETGRVGCDLYVFVDRKPPRPEREMIAFEDLQPLWTPSIAQKHGAMAGLSGEQLAALPEEGLEVTVDCWVQRQRGHLMCGMRREDRPEDLAVLGAARQIGEAYAFRTDNLEPASDIVLETRLTLRLKASDLIPFVAPAEGTVLPMNAVSFSRALGREWLAEKAQDFRAGAYLMRALCQIQVDHSVICGRLSVEVDGELSTGGGARAVAFTGGQMISALQAAPLLADGSPSAGRWFVFSQSLRVTG